MRTNFSIDWLGFTSDIVTLPTPGMYAYAAHKAGWTADKARNGYRVAYRNENGASVSWNEDRPDMRVLTQYSGKALEHYIDDGVEPIRIANFHAQQGARLTRIDLAIDIHDKFVDIPELYKMLNDGRAKSASTKYNLIVGSDGGSTLYVGSRQSDKMLRAYDKAAEQAVPGFWYRFELEIKNDVANEIGKRLSTMTGFQLVSMTKGLLSNMVSFPQDWWKLIVNNDYLIDWTISHKQSDNIKNWLADQVAPALANYMLRGGDSDIIEQLAIMVDSQINRKSRL